MLTTKLQLQLQQQQQSINSIPHISFEFVLESHQHRNMSTTIIASTTSFTSTTASSTSSPSLSSSAFTATATASSLANSQLTTISKISELHQLRDLYRRDWPAHCVGYYCLNNFIDWMEKRQQLNSVEDMKNLQIFTLDNDWHSDGLFLIVDRYQLFVNSLLASEDSERLTKAVSLLDWSWPGFKVSSFRERHRPSVLSVVRDKKLPIEYDSLTPMYYMPRAEALKLTINEDSNFMPTEFLGSENKTQNRSQTQGSRDCCPEGYVVRPLNAASDTEIIDTLWPNRHQGSRFFIQRQIEWNANMGVYTKDTDELVAWCLRLQGGFLGALQVKETHKRRGLGSLVAAAISRRIAEQGDDVMALVGKDNRASCGMFGKLGFKVVDTCYWLRTFPIKDVERLWPDGE